MYVCVYMCTYMRAPQKKSSNNYLWFLYHMAGYFLDVPLIYLFARILKEIFYLVGICLGLAIPPTCLGKGMYTFILL